MPRNFSKQVIKFKAEECHCRLVFEIALAPRAKRQPNDRIVQVIIDGLKLHTCNYHLGQMEVSENDQHRNIS